jgi:autotransporter-associated beta strand protein
MNTQTNCKAVQNRVRKLRKNFLPILLAVAGVLAGVSEGRATNYAAIDFGIGYTNGTNLVGQNGWGQVGSSNTNQPIQVTNNTVSLKGVSTLAQSAYLNLTTPLNVTNTNGTTVFYYVFDNFTVKEAYVATGANGSGVAGLTTTTNGGGTTYARLYIRKFGGSTTATNFDLGINSSGAGAVYGNTPLVKNTSYKVVVAYTANSSGLDKTTVYVNPSGQDPAAWTSEVTQTNATDPTTTLKSFVLQQGAVSTGYNQFTSSRIMIGDATADVLPPPAAPTVSEAAGISTSGFVANWSASSGATKYYLDVATDTGFTTYVSGFQNLDVSTAVSKSVTGTFTAGQSIFYRVRSSNSNGTSVNSATQEVVITAAPVVLVPTVTNSTTSGTVSWTSGPDWIPNKPISTNTATVTLNGALSGNLVANNDSAGNFVLNAVTNAITGAGSLTYTGGTFQFVANGITNPTLTFANNALVQTFSNNIQVDAELKVNQAGSTASNSILAGPISGTGGVYKSGNGTVLITRTDNTFDGVTTVGAGQLTVPNLGNSGSPSSLGKNASISLGGGTATGTLRWESAGSETSDKSIVLTGSTGGGMLDVRGTNNILTLGGSVNTGANAGPRTFTVTGDGSATLNGLISGNASLRVNGSKTRTVILANRDNSFSGTVTIDGNINGQSTKVQVSAIGNAGLNSPLGVNGTINIGSTVSGSYNFLVWSNTVAETTDKTINLAGATGGHALINNKGPALLKFTTGLTATGAGAKTLYADQDDANGVTEFAAAIPDSSLGGATALNKNGAGTLILSASNTFTGGFTLKGGTLELKHAQSLAVGNVLTFPNSGTGSGRVKVAYAGVGSDLGNLLVQADATIDLGRDNTAEIRFSSATGWTAAKILTIANSTGGGKMYILSPAGVDLAQIKSLENPTWPASLDTNGLLTFTNPAPANSKPVVTDAQVFSVSENIPLASAVGTVVASDADTNSSLSGWAIVSGNTGGVFAINSANGQITVAGALNYEGTSSYSLGVTVSDGTDTSAVATVVISVTNVIEYSDFFGSSSPTADDNGDGISNLMAYALGAASPSSAVLLPALNTTDSTKLTITALIRINDPKISVVGEYGTTPGTWQTASPITGVDSSDQTGAVVGVTKRKDFSVDRGTDPKKFLHLKATQTQ